MYALIGFLCICIGFAAALGGKKVPAALALMLVGALLVFAQMSHHP